MCRSGGLGGSVTRTSGLPSLLPTDPSQTEGRQHGPGLGGQWVLFKKSRVIFYHILVNFLESQPPDFMNTLLFGISSKRLCQEMYCTVSIWDNYDGFLFSWSQSKPPPPSWAVPGLWIPHTQVSSECLEPRQLSGDWDKARAVVEGSGHLSPFLAAFGVAGWLGI